MSLRPYQKDAVRAIERDLPLPGSALVVMPTASGKSHVIASTAAAMTPVLILQPSRELLAQNKAKLSLLVDEKDIGIYSASFKQKDIKTFTFATIQSVYKHGALFKHIPLVIIDEAHGLAPRSLGTMYQTFLKDMGNPKVIGLTATPYRLEVGYYKEKDGSLMQATMLKMINRSRHKSQKEVFWKRIIYNISHETLLQQGYLSPIEYVYMPLMHYSEIPVNISHSDYNLEAYAKAIVGREADIINTIGEAQRRFKSVLVFCATVAQAMELQKVIKGSEIVTAKTHAKIRPQIIEGFKNGSIKTVFNVGTLTTGFDHPSLDCIILLRPTRSLVLYQQILGRLTRLAPGKTKGTLIDLTGTAKALGRVETFELYLNERRLWDLRTEKHNGWHDRILFTRAI